MKSNPEYEKFNDAIDVILKADPKSVKEQLEAEKKANAEKRKAKKPSASDRASNGKD